jgi:hypothetical protein
VGDGRDTSNEEDVHDADELDLFEAGEMEEDESMLAELADELGCSRPDARTALRHAAMALTRASLLAGSDNDNDDDAEEDEENGTT